MWWRSRLRCCGIIASFIFFAPPTARAFQNEPIRLHVLSTNAGGRQLRLTPRPTPHQGRQALSATSKEDQNNGAFVATIYKDDCFGFTTFVAGFAVQDYLFTGIFVALSLLGDILTRVGALPPDPKRPSIVDRRVPGTVALLTLFLRYVAADWLVDVEAFVGDDMDAIGLARNVQLAFCIFSFVTAFLDVRWRDRFDYPDDPV